RSCFVNTSCGFLCIRRSSQERSHVQTPRFPPPGRGRGPLSRLRRYYQGAKTSCAPSRLASLPSLGGTTAAPILRSRVAIDAPPPAVGLLGGGRPAVTARVAVEDTGPPKFSQDPLAGLLMLLRLRTDSTGLAFFFFSPRLRGP